MLPVVIVKNVLTDDLGKYSGHQDLDCVLDLKVL